MSEHEQRMNTVWLTFCGFFSYQHAGSETIAVPGFEKKYLQFVDASAILERVTIIPKPSVYYSNRAVHLGPCEIDDDLTKFWVHNIGVTKAGET